MPQAHSAYDVLVFDWDGTLVDSTAHIAEAILRAAADVGVAVPDRAQAAHVIGLGLAQALARVVPDLPRERIPEFSARYRVHFGGAEEAICLFAGAREALDALRARGVRMAIATGKTHAGLARSLARSGLQEHFEAVRCADRTQPKPHPAMLLELAQELATPVERMLMIGDTSHDLQMAASAGAGMVGVAFGAHSRAELEAFAPLAIFDAPAQLHRWLLENFPGRGA
jgi:phosphoglycolate phosphatase